MEMQLATFTKGGIVDTGYMKSINASIYVAASLMPMIIKRNKLHYIK